MNGGWIDFRYNMQYNKGALKIFEERRTKNMNLKDSGRLIAVLRKEKGLTQKQVADKLGVVAKTVSKWETGNGFPDVSSVERLAAVLGVSTETLLRGKLDKNGIDAGNIKKTRLCVCPACGSVVQGTGNFQISCCGKKLTPLRPQKADGEHEISVSVTDNEFYVRILHEMTKPHYISFLMYVGVDRYFLVKLYPEQDAAVRMPQMHGGKFYYYCTQHGLFECEMQNAACKIEKFSPR